MNNKLILKKFDIDYSFIIKNYLEPEMWQKTWTLFEYKKFVIQLYITSIETRNQKIYFTLRITDNNKSCFNTREIMVCYSLKTDIKFLITAINNKIYELIICIERDFYIERSYEYDYLTNLVEEEEKKLIKIAIDFLDNNNIGNENIRETYIDAYIENTETVYFQRIDYIKNSKYKFIPDLYLMFARSINDSAKEEEILHAKEDKREQILNEAKEYEKYMQTEEFNEDKASNLDEI